MSVTLVIKEYDISKLEGNILTIDESNQELDILKLIDYYKDKDINAHELKPNYLKKIDAESMLW